MSLQLGKWKINMNGLEGELSLNSLNLKNVLTGQIVINNILMPPSFSIGIQGFWDETERTILFSIETDGEGGSRFLPILFKGFLFSTPPTPELGQDILWTLTGFYQVSVAIGVSGLPLTVAEARRNTFGWFAQITEVS